jgi:hypothetical protein
MLNFIRNHPYITGGLIVFVILFLLGIFVLDTTLEETLIGSAGIAIVGALGFWWKEEGLG